MTSQNQVNIEELLEEKRQILLRRRNTPKSDIEAIKAIDKEYLRVYVKIKYHTNEDIRINKCNSSNIYNKTHKETYNEYHKVYQASRKLNVVA